MSIARRIISTALACALAGVAAVPAASAQRRRRPTPTRSPATSAGLTGTYSLAPSASDDPRTIAERATRDLPTDLQQRTFDEVMTRLSPPDFISIERRGNSISMASSRAMRVSFNATGRDAVERAPDGHTVRTRATVYGEQLMVSSTGSRDDEYSVNFDSIDGGRRLRVTRRINSDQFSRPVVIRSIYERVSDVARWDVYGRVRPPDVSDNAGNNPPARINRAPGQQGGVRRFPPPSAPRIQDSNEAPAPPADVGRDEGLAAIRSGEVLTAVLNENLSTRQSREGDRFTLTVREPSRYRGAVIEGYVAGVTSSGRIAGRSELTLNFDQMRLPDGRVAAFDGFIEGVRAEGGEEVRVGTEGRVQDRSDQTRRTTERVAIGAAVGAIIGAIAGGGKGAAIGAAVGAGAGAGSVYIQGRDELDLPAGTELTVRAGGPR